MSAEKSRKGSKDSISKSDLSKIESRTTVITKTGSSGSEGKTNTGSSSRGAGKDKAKPKVKAWQAPVYAGEYSRRIRMMNDMLTFKAEFSFG